MYSLRATSLSFELLNVPSDFLDLHLHNQVPPCRLEDQESSALQDWRLLSKLSDGDRDVDWFFTILAVCHTVIPEYVDIDIDRDDVRYQATSPGWSTDCRILTTVRFI